MTQFDQFDFLNRDIPRFSSYNQWLLESFRNRTKEDQKIVCVFVDAFGWMFFERFRERSPLLQRFQSEGIVERTLSQFPSTTACHVTSIHFGMPVAQTGIFEWNYYEPLVDAVISPLPFSYAGDSDRETLVGEGYAGADLFPFKTFYETLHEQNIASYVFQSSKHAESVFSIQAFKGAEVRPFESEQQGLEGLAHCVKNHEGPGYFFLYLDRLDATAHRFGPNASETMRTGLDVLRNIDDYLISAVRETSGTRVVIISDHGHSEVSPSKIAYLDRQIPESVNWFRKNLKGEPLVAAGSMRDFFLYIEPQFHQKAMETLSDHFSGIADVIETKELIEKGYFGPVETIEARFYERMANVVILPFLGEAVWWSGGGKYEKAFMGMHGGLSQEEVEICRLTLDF